MEEKINIDVFLEGVNPKERIVAIESDYFENEVSLIIDDEKKGMVVEKHTYTPFLFMKNLKRLQNPLYGGDRNAMMKASEKHVIKFTKLRTDNEIRLE